MTKKEAILNEIEKARIALLNIKETDPSFLKILQINFIWSMLVFQIKSIKGSSDNDFFIKIAKLKRRQCIINAKKPRNSKKKIKGNKMKLVKLDEWGNCQICGEYRHLRFGICGGDCADIWGKQGGWEQDKHNPNLSKFSHNGKIWYYFEERKS